MKHPFVLSNSLRLNGFGKHGRLSIRRGLQCGLSLLLLAGCSTPPKLGTQLNTQSAQSDKPLSAAASAEIRAASLAKSSFNLNRAPGAALLPQAAPNASLVDWWRYFGNSELEGLIDRGLSNNPDMRIALNRLVQAKARVDQVGGGQMPVIGDPLAVPVPELATMATTATMPPADEMPLQIDIRADWRLDLRLNPSLVSPAASPATPRGQSALADSAHFQLWRAIYERENVQRNLAAAIAALYVESLSINDRLKIALQAEEGLSAMLAAVEQRVKTGVAAESEFEQHKAAIFSLRAWIPVLEQQRLETINSLATLVGTAASDINLSDAGMDSLIIPAVVSGLHSTLLLRRPDILVAEAQLRAADADIAVARARILPPMDLAKHFDQRGRAQPRYPSTDTSPQVVLAYPLDSLTAGIFDAAQRMKDPVFSQAVYEEMVESYVQVVHQAMREVETALALIKTLNRQLQAQQETIGAAQRAWEINGKAYAKGGIDHFALLDSQRSYQRYLNEYQLTRMQFYRSYIILFHALGGGVKPGETLAVTNRVPAQPLAADAEKPAFAYEGILISEGRGANAAAANAESANAEFFWQVELAGLYHRSTIAAVWRDLRARYPNDMQKRVLRSRLSGGIDLAAEGMQSWHRVFVAKFATPQAAEEFCQALKASQQRCRVVSSRFDDPLPVKSPSKAAPRLSSPAADKAELARLPAAALVSAEVNVAKADVAETDVAKVNKIDGVQTSALPEPSEIVIQSASTAEIPVERAVEIADEPPIEIMAEPVSAVGVPPAPPAFGFAMQFGAYANKKNAERASAALKNKGLETYVTQIRDRHDQLRYAVRAGYFAQRQEGRAKILSLDRKERSQVLLVPVVAESTVQ